MLTIEFIGGFNPFDFIKCPLCGGTNFVSLSLAGVWCDDCNASFSVRSTAGDPGCVVDCHTKNAYAPAYECSCGRVVGYWGQTPPVCCNTPMTPKKGYSSPQLNPTPPSYYYWILKTGDYSSGWLRREGPLLEGMDYQKEWEAYQEKCACALQGQYEIAASITKSNNLRNTKGDQQ